MRTCKKCLADKFLEDFPKQGEYRRHTCKVCYYAANKVWIENNKEKYLTRASFRNRKRYAAEGIANQKRSLVRNLGITIEEASTLITLRRESSCEICGTPAAESNYGSL